MRPYRLIAAALVVGFLFYAGGVLAGYEVVFKDASGRIHQLTQPPASVVSLVPSVTELLFHIGVGDAVCGVTYHDVYPPQAAVKPLVGGFFAPSVERITALQADVVFLDDIHQPVADVFAEAGPPRLVQLPLNTFGDLYRTIRLLGRIFDRGRAAEALIREIKADVDHTSAKIAAIPLDQRKRVMRLMGRNQVMTPGDNSFQNEMIRLAGGIPPTLVKPGEIVPVTLEAWQAFNPQVLYGCGGDRDMLLKMVDRPGWREVDAVKNGRIIYFPCDLICRLSSRSGYFVSYLASRVYGDEYAHLPSVRPDGRIASQSFPLALDYVADAEIVESTVNDFIHKTLLIRLNAPMAVASTLEGFRERIRFVGNSYSPPQTWGLYHHIGLEASRRNLMQSIGRDGVDTSLLFTGADMDNLSIQRRQFKQMSVYALVTAGVRSNAVRMAEDIGAFYEPGTINMIIMTNMQLTSRAMNRAIITATEAKTAALLDLDIRSSFTPMRNPATGTGTDNVIVVQGTGPRIDNTGGHSKMGELIAKAVYNGVQEAIFKQNGIARRRHLVHRLEDRKISLFGLVADCPCGIQGDGLTSELESLLLDPTYAGFIESALAISDQYERGLITNTSLFKNWCDQIAVRIAGHGANGDQVFCYAQPLPPVLKMAFDAILNGIYTRNLPVVRN